MSLDNEPMKVSAALKIAAQYYSQEKLEHVLRVAIYVSENNMIPEEYMDECVALAIMHDLLEDTTFKPDKLPENFKRALEILTKAEDVNYDEYCKYIKKVCCLSYGKCAYWVKMADMKDHLSLTDTLTDRLKAKYLSGLKYLL